MEMEEIQKKLDAYPGWILRDNKLEKKYEFKDFSAMMDFVNKVAAVAEELNHHPDLFIHDWNKLTITSISHDKNAITDRDFRLVEAIEALDK